MLAQIQLHDTVFLQYSDVGRLGDQGRGAQPPSSTPVAGGGGEQPDQDSRAETGDEAAGL